MFLLTNHFISPNSFHFFSFFQLSYNIFLRNFVSCFFLSVALDQKLEVTLWFLKHLADHSGNKSNLLCVTTGSQKRPWFYKFLFDVILECHCRPIAALYLKGCLLEGVYPCFLVIGLFIGGWVSLFSCYRAVYWRVCISVFLL